MQYVDHRTHVKMYTFLLLYQKTLFYFKNNYIAHVGHNSYQLLAAIGIKDKLNNQYKDWNQKVQVDINLTHMVKNITKFIIWQYYFTLIYTLVT